MKHIAKSIVAAAIACSFPLAASAASDAMSKDKAMDKPVGSSGVAPKYPATGAKASDRSQGSSSESDQRAARSDEKDDRKATGKNTGVAPQYPQNTKSNQGSNDPDAKFQPAKPTDGTTTGVMPSPRNQDSNASTSMRGTMDDRDAGRTGRSMESTPGSDDRTAGKGVAPKYPKPAS